MRRTTAATWALGALALALAVGCETASTCSVGGEGCACTEGGSCDPGLSCLSATCVRPGGDGGGGGGGDVAGPSTDAAAVEDPGPAANCEKYPGTTATAELDESLGTALQRFPLLLRTGGTIRSLDGLACSVVTGIPTTGPAWMTCWEEAVECGGCRYRMGYFAGTGELPAAWYLLPDEKPLPATCRTYAGQWTLAEGCTPGARGCVCGARGACDAGLVCREGACASAGSDDEPYHCRQGAALYCENNELRDCGSDDLVRDCGACTHVGPGTGSEYDTHCKALLSDWAASDQDEARFVGPGCYFGFDIECGPYSP